MSTTARRVFTGLTRVSFSRGEVIHNGTSTVRANSVRPLTLSVQRSANSTDDENKKVTDDAIKFSSSKASHKTWQVKRAIGGQYQRPWWKILPITLLLGSFVLWCGLRGETDLDVQLERHLHKTVPSLASDEEEEEDESS